MRKVIQIVIALMCLLTLSSCVKMDINLTVNKDSTISGYTIFAFEKSLAEMAGSQSESPANNLINSDAEGVTVSEYNQDGFIGQKYSFENVPFSEFSKSKNPKDALQFVKDGNTISVIGALDFSSEESGSGSDALSAAWAKSVLASAELDMAITFPGKVVKSTGKISEDGYTVSWKPALGEKLDLATTVELPSAINWILPTASLLLLAFLGGAIFFLTRKRSEKVGIE